LKSLKEAIPVCDEVNIYDNTDMFREIIDFESGKLIWKHRKIPVWANYII